MLIGFDGNVFSGAGMRIPLFNIRNEIICPKKNTKDVVEITKLKVKTTPSFLDGFVLFCHESHNYFEVAFDERGWVLDDGFIWKYLPENLCLQALDKMSERINGSIIKN